jgi:hypothetical protein
VDNSVKFFNNEIRFSVWFDGSNSFVLGVTIREVDIVPLLMELILDFDGFVDIVVNGIHIISSELDLHTIGFPWPLEDG